MPNFAMFFDAAAGAGIQRVQALDAGHAADIVQANHPGARLGVVDLP
ncbi:hypothetical protein [Cyanobium sp. WAJ14-Wanaka]|nr:hypothetical protein [Cyanobium sp. WAJ14-Wanaka]MCP9774821.1 hypothetical protein [Cyanobium sp. WAJ14-Wanaka]